jgi:uroporphyrinogen decarboxylase
MVEGKGSRTFDHAKAFCYQYPAIAHALLQDITTVTINYLQGQINAGADCVQLFDSWAAVWDKEDFSVYCLPYIQQIVAAVKDLAPVIVYAKGAWHSLPQLQETGAAALGLDWCNTPEFARQITGNKITLQGNYDPVKLLQPVHKIKEDVFRMINSFGAQQYIVNLGHGILPNIPVEHARAFVEAVKEWKL